MRHPQKPAFRKRAGAVTLALLVHGSILLPFLLGKFSTRQDDTSTLSFVSLWPDPERPEPEIGAAATPAGIPKPLPHVASPQVTTLIPSEAEEDDAPVALADDSWQTSSRGIDWQAAATAAAKRLASGLDSPPRFSPPPNALPKPCKPREFDDDTKKQMANLLPEPPDPLPVGPDPTAGCLLVGGRPMCVQKLSIPLGGAEPDGDLFKDMAGKKRASSVPSPHGCN